MIHEILLLILLRSSHGLVESTITHVVKLALVLHLVWIVSLHVIVLVHLHHPLLLHLLLLQHQLLLLHSAHVVWLNSHVLTHHWHLLVGNGLVPKGIQIFTLGL